MSRQKRNDAWPPTGLLALAVLIGTLVGCIRPAATRRQTIPWPDANSTELVAPSMEAGAALAAAAAVREMVKTNPFPNLFAGCSSPEQGLNVAVFKDPASGLYFVVLEQRFNRCGGPSGRVLDWWFEYAVTPQGEVVAEAPYGGEPVPAPEPASSPTEQQSPGPPSETSTPSPASPPPPPPPASPAREAPPSPPVVPSAPEAPPAPPATPS